MSTVFRKIRRAGPGVRRFGIAWAGCRGAARWLALAVLAVAAAGFAAAPALADSFVTVTTTSDENAVDGTCSLPEAILYAQNQNAGNTDCGTTATGTTTIIVPAGHYAVPVAGGAFPPDAHLEIRSGGPGPIVIAGASTTGTVIDGQGQYPRLLLVGAGANVTIRNLTLRGGVVWGHQGDGGGIDNLGTLMLDHVTVTGNQTWLTFPYAGATPGYDRGGGIFNSGTVTLLNSIVSGNSTAKGAYGKDAASYCGDNGHDGQPGADGGGIYNQGGTMTAINTTIAGNATGAGGDGSPGGWTSQSYLPCKNGGFGGPGSHGGRGGGIFNNNGIVTLRQSAVYGNTTGAGGHGGDGGFGSSAGGWGAQGGGGGAGAGIYNNGMLTVVNTTITGNATGNGGVAGVGGQSSNPAGAGAGGGPRRRARRGRPRRRHLPGERPVDRAGVDCRGERGRCRDRHRGPERGPARQRDRGPCRGADRDRHHRQQQRLLRLARRPDQGRPDGR